MWKKINKQPKSCKTVKQRYPWSHFVAINWSEKKANLFWDRTRKHPCPKSYIFEEELLRTVKTGPGWGGCGRSTLLTELEWKQLTSCLSNMRHLERGKISDLLFGEEEVAPGSFSDSPLIPQREREAKEWRINEERNERKEAFRDREERICDRPEALRLLIFLIQSVEQGLTPCNHKPCSLGLRSEPERIPGPSKRSYWK